MTDRFFNQGKKWTQAMETELTDLWYGDHSLGYIMDKTGRGYLGVTARLRQLGLLNSRQRDWVNNQDNESINLWSIPKELDECPVGAYNDGKDWDIDELNELERLWVSGPATVKRIAEKMGRRSDAVAHKLKKLKFITISQFLEMESKNFVDCSVFNYPKIDESPYASQDMKDLFDDLGCYGYSFDDFMELIYSGNTETGAYYKGLRLYLKFDLTDNSHGDIIDKEYEGDFEVQWHAGLNPEVYHFLIRDGNCGGTEVEYFEKVSEVVKDDMGKSSETKGRTKLKVDIESNRFYEEFVNLNEEKENMCRRVVNIRLFDDDPALDADYSLVGSYLGVVTEERNEVVIQELLMGAVGEDFNVKEDLETHNNNRKEQVDLKILENTGQEVKLREVKLKDLRWDVSQA